MAGIAARVAQGLSAGTGLWVLLHGNAKQTLALVQWVLRMVIAPRVLRPRPVFRCPKCQSPMCIVALVRPAWRFG